MDAIQERPATVFFECERKMMNVFDVEMAIATAKAFSLCNNAEKNRFNIDFINMWQNYTKWPDIKILDTVQGLKKLLELLKTEKESLQQQNKAIATGHTDKFIKMVEELIEKSAET